MKPHKNILFTFDYELFLGNNSGSVQNCLLRPTKIIADLLYDYNYQAIFFIDTTYLLSLQKIAKNHATARKDFDAIVAQLQTLAAQNHRICAHIHPHWADAQYAPGTNTWRLVALEKYRFNALTAAEQTQIFDDSIAFLYKILPNNAPNAYRAGGWCIQPFVDFMPHFVRHKIFCDFSVLPHQKNLSNAQYYDFSDAPQQPIYHFDTDPATENINGKFTEFAISMLNKNAWSGTFSRIFNKILWHTPYRCMGDGQGVQAAAQVPPPPATHQMVAIELLDIVNLRAHKDFLHKNDYMQFISHPKMLGAHNIFVFEKLLKFIHKNFDASTDFTKML